MRRLTEALLNEAMQLQTHAQEVKSQTAPLRSGELDLALNSTPKIFLAAVLFPSENVGQ